MFTKITLNPIRHRDLILYGIFLKAAYCAVSGWYWLAAGIPNMWKPFTVIDLVMGILFIWAYAILTSAASEVKEA
jgi:DMSO reductase anchor subunit